VIHTSDPCRVSLEAATVEGRKLETVKEEMLAGPGEHVISWNPGITAPGVYFARVKNASGASATARFVVLE
jgi:hypothetical protein